MQAHQFILTPRSYAVCSRSVIMGFGQHSVETAITALTSTGGVSNGNAMFSVRKEAEF
jgi:hypothetical protein